MRWLDRSKPRARESGWGLGDLSLILVSLVVVLWVLVGLVQVDDENGRGFFGW